MCVSGRLVNNCRCCVGILCGESSLNKVKQSHTTTASRCSWCEMVSTQGSREELTERAQCNQRWHFSDERQNGNSDLLVWPRVEHIKDSGLYLTQATEAFPGYLIWAFYPLLSKGFQQEKLMGLCQFLNLVKPHHCWYLITKWSFISRQSSL